MNRMTQNASGLAAQESTSHQDASQAVEVTDRPDRDRIAEAYLGRWGSAVTQQRARDRVDWMAARAQGPRVLDIGCSEGMLGLLLARAGHQVLGIDIEPAAIAAARDLLGAESSAVCARVELRVADALSVELDEDGFDTVVLGEVIEHLDQPSKMLARAADLLKPRGRLVLTTPFGYFPHPDHRQQFRTTELIALIRARFVIDELTIVDGYFRVIAHAAGVAILQERRVPDLHQLLVATEEAAIAAQKHLRGQLALKERALEHLRGQLTLKERALEHLRGQLTLKERALEHLRGQLALKESALEHQKRITASARLRMQQAQTRLRQQQKGLRQELGRAVEKSLGSPFGIFWLPLRIAKAYRRARRRAAAGLCAPSSLDTQRELAAPALAEPRHRDISSAFPPYMFPDRASRCAVRVATILDEFSDACFRYEAELIRLTKETWRAQIEREQPHFLLVESAWRGNRENWRGLIKHARHTRDNPLEALVRYCNSRGIPTVFWNKEDPPNFEGFIDAAAQFDFVFTTDANCIERYRDRLGHERMAALPFAAQPALHNPIGKQESDDYEIAFAGTWYGQKHEERGALLPILLDAAAAHKLHIFDRMSDYTQNDCYRFPDRYAAFLRTALPYPNVLSAYRNFKLFLNVNSVTDSPTMFARRVFEILASSTAVVSTASSGIEQMLGDVVALVHDEDEARAEFDQLLSDAAYRQRKAHLGHRRVTREHTYAARFRTIARTIGVDVETSRHAPEVSVIIPLADQRWFENALANLRRQRHVPLETVWVLRGGAGSDLAERVAREDPAGVILEAGADAPLGIMLRCGLESARGALVTVFEPRDLYGPEFIGDLVLAMSYADVEMVGKGAYFSAPPSGDVAELCRWSARYRYVDEVMASAWLARRDFVRRVGLDQILKVEDDGRAVVRANGSAKIYGADPYNYLRLADADPTCAARAALAERGGPLGMRHPDVMI
jgi:2-polyprenyl-3-methyl-5-hydroxy-6-metoxy-1,4-benzoquinol methylase/spore maturation protein CgeB